MPNHFKADHYATKGTAQGHAQGSDAQTQYSVLSHNPSSFNASSAEATPDHALVVLQEGKGANAKPLATFTPQQAHQLANALHAAADQHDIC